MTEKRENVLAMERRASGKKRKTKKEGEGKKKREKRKEEETGESVPVEKIEKSEKKEKRDQKEKKEKKKSKKREKKSKKKRSKSSKEKKPLNLSSSSYSSFLEKFGLDREILAAYSSESRRLELEYLVASESWEKRYQTPSESEKRLLIASENGNLEEVRRCVLENGASVHIRSRDCGWTPLHLGSSEPDVVRFLLEQEADPNAREDRHPDFLDEEQGSEIGNRLTPLLFACSHGNLESVKLMVEKGGDLSRLNCDGETVLHLAVEAGEMSLIRFLVQYNPQLVTTPDSSGRYPFGGLVRDGNIEGMKLFIQHGAQVDELVDGESYIRIATFFKQTEAKKFLLRHCSETKVKDKFSTVSIKRQQDPIETSLQRYKSIA